MEFNEDVAKASGTGGKKGEKMRTLLKEEGHIGEVEIAREYLMNIDTTMLKQGQAICIRITNLYDDNREVLKLVTRKFEKVDDIINRELKYYGIKKVLIKDNTNKIWKT